MSAHITFGGDVQDMKRASILLEALSFRQGFGLGLGGGVEFPPPSPLGAGGGVELPPPSPPDVPPSFFSSSAIFLDI